MTQMDTSDDMVMNHKKEKERKALDIIFSFFSADEWLDCFDF